MSHIETVLVVVLNVRGGGLLHRVDGIIIIFTFADDISALTHQTAELLLSELYDYYYYYYSVVLYVKSYLQCNK